LHHALVEMVKTLGFLKALPKCILYILLVKCFFCAQRLTKYYLFMLVFALLSLVEFVHTIVSIINIIKIDMI